MNVDRLPPYNIDIEKSVLYCLIQNTDNLYDIDLTGSEFYEKTHRLIFLWMLDLRNEHKTIDIVTIAHKVWQEWQEYLLELSVYMLTTSWFHDYVTDLKDLYYRRELIKHGSMLDWKAKDMKVDVEAIVSSSHSFFNDLLITQQKEETIGEAINEIIRKAWTEEMVIGKWWYDKLDDVTGWFREWKISVVAWESWSGKTTVAINAMNQLIYQWVRSHIISLEMDKQEIMRRIFDIRYDVNKYHFDKRDSKFIMEYLWDKWYMDDVLKLPEYISISCPRQLDTAVYSDIYRNYYQNWVKVFFIDYLGLIEVAKSRWWIAYDIWSITKRLKDISRELKIHICILVQFNRDASKRPNKDPKKSDLRDSWSIEHDADFIIWLLIDEDDALELIGEKLLQLHVIKNRDWICGKIWYRQKRLKIYNEEKNIP